MNNIPKIILFQYLPAYVNQLLQKIENIFVRKIGNDLTIIENIDHFKSEISKIKHALISLSPYACLTVIKKYRSIKYFNIIALTYEIVKVLDGKGYFVNNVDLNKEHNIQKI